MLLQLALLFQLCESGSRDVSGLSSNESAVEVTEGVWLAVLSCCDTSDPLLSATQRVSLTPVQSLRLCMPALSYRHNLEQCCKLPAFSSTLCCSPLGTSCTAWSRSDQCSPSLSLLLVLLPTAAVGVCPTGGGVCPAQGKPYNSGVHLEVGANFANL